uniref:Protein translocase subunit SecA n=1 Tax=Hildenbrandia rivularis TaxID=135206 RepID=A0A1C9CFI6_9FLOR|nr:preprotein translocase subunit SecA [Hildenbrandia rivularis]AOM67117.1 preprotein translocase subunit SecA [Hildenbrandia rivularis]
MFKFLIKNFTARHFSKYKLVVSRINTLAKKLKHLNDKELQEQTIILKRRFKSGESLNDLIIDAFAVVKEATYRLLGLELFDVQLLGGIILHEGKIAEMQTGEGKTLVATLPAYLNALSGKTVHIITVNDYLTERDRKWVGRIPKFLQLSVGLIQPDMTYRERQDNYSCNIVYVTNSQLGFDYLKDNMAISKNEIVQQPFYFGIIDEVDSVLIDEARTPLIISGFSESSTDRYTTSNILSQLMKKDVDYDIDQKNRSITLTDEGILFCEDYLSVSDLYSLDNPWIQYILNSLRAKELFIKNIHYILQNNSVLIVDEFTGRVMKGRRWSDGLHQAIEAKEDMPIQNENKTLASITYQNLFLLYTKLSGMTGTAKTEEREFNKIYNLEVISVPTNKLCIRQDFPDLVYRNEHSKWKAVANECLTMYHIGRPTLVGTSSIEKSEILAAILNKCSIPYNLLNAKPENVRKEAEIIAQAGRKFSITIATNMAGRGTDIILGGNLRDFTKSYLIDCVDQHLHPKTLHFSDCQYKSSLLDNTEKKTLKDLIIQYLTYAKDCNISVADLENSITQITKVDFPTKIHDRLLKQAYQIIFNKHQKLFEVEKQDVIKLGGLHVIGTERHESRRIDNQLRGRAGRQGDPGSSRFFLSLEDNLLKVFGGDALNKVMRILQVDDQIPIESSIITNSLNSAQKKVESYFYNIRKQLLEYDEVLSDQRQAIYIERKRILQSSNCRDSIIEYIEVTISELINKYSLSKDNVNDNLVLVQTISSVLNINYDFNLYKMNILNQEKIYDFFCEQAYTNYDLQEAYLNKIDTGLIRELEKYYLLQQIDNGWQRHLENMTCLRDSISLRGYAQQDPLTEYKRIAFSLFILMISYVRQTVVFLMFNTK